MEGFCVSEVPMARILVIDDEKAFKGILRKALEKEGHEVLEAQNERGHAL